MERVLGDMPAGSEELLMRSVDESNEKVDRWSSVCHCKWAWTHDGNWQGFGVVPAKQNKYRKILL